MYFEFVYADFNVSAVSKNGDKGPNFESLFTFYGDAKLVRGHDKSIKMSGSVAPTGACDYVYLVRVLYVYNLFLFFYAEFNVW